MKAVDYRNATFAELKGQLDKTRGAIWNAMQADGRALTTREIAALTGIDLLTVRPRVTELVQLGFVVLATDNPKSSIPNPKSNEGRYRALSNFDALRLFEERSRVAREPQLSLAL